MWSFRPSVRTKRNGTNYEVLDDAHAIHEVLKLTSFLQTIVINIDNEVRGVLQSPATNAVVNAIIYREVAIETSNSTYLGNQHYKYPLFS